MSQDLIAIRRSSHLERIGHRRTNPCKCCVRPSRVAAQQLRPSRVTIDRRHRSMDEVARNLS